MQSDVKVIEANDGPTQCTTAKLWMWLSRTSGVLTLKFSDSIMLKRSSLRPIVLSTS